MTDAPPLTLNDAPTGTLLRAYLTDHYAGALAGEALAKRSHRNNAGTQFEEQLETLASEIEEDRQSLRTLMRRMQIPVSPAKSILAAAAERVARLKLNGQVMGYSPLSRLVEFEGLWTGVAGKRNLWRSMRELPADQLPIGIDLDDLEARADSQLERLAEMSRRAARHTFAE